VDEFFARCKEQVDATDPSAGECRVTVTLETPARSRQGKPALREELENLVSEAVSRNGSAWIKKGYRFAFAEREYFWNGVPLYFTAGEEVFLFRWLVLGDTAYRREKRCYLSDLRKRIGKEFLTEADK
jgi:hypothetical protein